jgi:aminoglycoside phosphotransferase (APT) family kinase protein
LTYDLDKAVTVLREMLPAGTPVTAIKPMTTGFSNDTYLVEGPDLILRLPPAAGAMLDGHDVLGQARIYRALGDAPGTPAVPGVSLICDDPAAMGAPFFVMECIAGEAVHDVVLQPWFTEAGDAVRARMCHEWVAAIAGLARLEPLPVLGEPVSPEDQMRMWQRFAGAADCPALVAAIERLLSRPAPRSGRPSVVHGDPKLSNLMWDDFRISAVLDWEMALNGEPLADLGYMLYLFASDFHGAARPCKLPGMLSRDEVIALWSQVSGRSADGLAWHEIAQIAKITAIIAEGVNMSVTGRSQDPKLALFKQNFDYYLGVIETMLDAGGF